MSPIKLAHKASRISTKKPAGLKKFLGAFPVLWRLSIEIRCSENQQSAQRLKTDLIIYSRLTKCCGLRLNKGLSKFNLEKSYRLIAPGVK